MAGAGPARVAKVSVVHPARSSMTEHVAIVRPAYVDGILCGQKTVESRLSRWARPPFRGVTEGDRIYFKRSGGGYAAVATAGRVWFFDGLDPAGVDRLRRRFGRRVGGDDAYWTGKRRSRYATFVELAGVVPVGDGPAIPRSRGCAWFTVGGAQTRSGRMLRFALTEGAIRNGYLRVARGVAGSSTGLRGGSGVCLVLPDGREVRTSVGENKMIRWRGWGAYYRRYGVRAGDRVELEPVDGDGYRVGFVHGSGS